MKKLPSRRQFLQAGAGAAGVAFAANAIPLRAEEVQPPTTPVPASDRIRFGMIGVGMQGSGLLEASISLPGVECAAACDLYDGRHTLAREIVKDGLREEYFKKWRQENDPKPGQEPLQEVETYRGPDYDEVRPHLWRFFQAVRSRQGIVQDAIFGHHAALACHMANESYFRKQPVTLDVATKTIKG
jgi:hypothetical protein